MMIARRLAIGAVALSVVALVASAWPLLTWSLTLAAFGLPHVLVELRWVDQRYGRRLGRSTIALFGVLLLGIVGVRVAGVAGMVDPAVLAISELVLVAALAATVVPVMMRVGVTVALIGVAVVLALAFGITRAPVDTLVVLAFLHNVTPVGLLAERLDGAARRQAMIACAVAFLVVPVLIASGLVSHGLGAVGVGSAGSGMPGAGTLLDNASVFVPSFVGAEHTVDLFRCAAYLQCLHYAVVLHVLPRLGVGEVPGGRLGWPEQRPFAVAVTVLGGLFLVFFSLAFQDARVIYGVFAAVHAWIEIPILLLVLTALASASAAESWTPTRSNSL